MSLVLWTEKEVNKRFYIHYNEWKNLFQSYGTQMETSDLLWISYIYEISWLQKSAAKCLVF